VTGANQGGTWGLLVKAKGIIVGGRQIFEGANGFAPHTYLVNMVAHC